MKKLSLYLFTSILLLNACGKETTTSKLNEAMNSLNNPANIPGANSGLITYPSGLPDTGNISKAIWSTYWYPYSGGGTVTALSKYDWAIGDGSKKASNWEQQEVEKLKGISWAGHCNGVSAAGTMVDEPRHDVSYNNVSFSIDDVKALIVDAWQASGAAVGGRCNDETIEYDSIGRMINSDCRDINPASFHIVLANFLGIFHKPIIQDIDPGVEVWNGPVVSYKIRMKQNLTTLDVNWWLLNVKKDTYAYNPNARSFVYYQTEVTMFDGTQKIYEYILELDSGGYIIGGEWYRNAKKDHPDFMWRATTPESDNPYLRIDVVYDIYSRSL